jgi:GNAT superfamily N-acetyltransferase
VSEIVRLSDGNWYEAFSLVEEFFKESPLFARLGAYPQSVVDEIAKTIREPQRVGFLGYVKDELAGLVIGRTVNLLFGPGCVAQDMIFYVRPKFRATLLIKRLVAAFEAWAWEDPGCRLVQLTALAGADNERAARLVEHFGFNSVGYVMVKERH